MTSTTNPGGYTEEVEAFMKALTSPDFKASQQPITASEADALREHFKSLSKQFATVQRALSEANQTVAALSSRVEFLETQEKALRDHYKLFNEFRSEVLSRLNKLEDPTNHA